MSAAGTKYRPGIVFSSLAATSFFSRTAISLPSVIVAPFLFGCFPIFLAHLDRSGLVTLGARQEEREDSIAVLRLDAVGVDLDRHRHRAIEPPREPLAAMHRGLLGIGYRFHPGEPQGAALHLHDEIVPFDARDFGNDDKVVAFAKYIHRRIGAGARRSSVQPAAGAKGVERVLKGRQRVERVGV